MDAQACSWGQAYQAAQTGDLILVRGGSYGDVKLGPNKSSIGAAGVTFRTAGGEQVVVDEFENGAYYGNGGGANNITLIGPVAHARSSATTSATSTVDGWNVDCQGCIGVQTFHIRQRQRRRPQLRDRQQPDDSLVWLSGSNISFENNRIHDAGPPRRLRRPHRVHVRLEVTNLTLKRNHFYHCAVMDVFITGNAVANGGYIENNVFEKPWEPRQIPTGLAFHFRNGGRPSPDPSNWDFRYNTFVGPLSISRARTRSAPAACASSATPSSPAHPAASANTN